MRKIVAIASLVVVLLITFFVLRMSPKSTARLQGSLLEMVSPFFKTGTAMRGNINAFTEGMQTLEQLERDNGRLRVENKELRAVNQVLRDLEAENNQLRAALDYKQRAVFSLVSAKVIGREPTSWWSSVQIDRGSDDGIRPDMPVLTDVGLVGKTMNVTKNTARVLLLVDETCKVAATVVGTQERGIVSGTRSSTPMSPQLVLEFLPKTAQLQPGMPVISSGIGGVFPAGLLLGVVKEFKVRELYAEAHLQPAVDFSTLQDLFIVVDRK